MPNNPNTPDNKESNHSKITTRLKKTFNTNDNQLFKKFAESCKAFILSQYLYFDESLVISLNGRFGTGKTWFLERFKSYLEEEQIQEVIYVNAWKNDYFPEPIVTILCALLDHMNTTPIKGENIDKIKNTIMKVVGFAFILGSQTLRHITGIDLEEASKFIDDSDCIRHGAAILHEYNQISQLYSDLNIAIHEYVKLLDDKPLVLLIDELDRCRPDYAVSFLETIKHFFTVKGVVFLLAVDKQQLESTVTCLFGDKLDFQEYYRKFVHRNITLPIIDQSATQEYVTSKIKELFNVKQHNGSFSGPITPISFISTSAKELVENKHTGTFAAPVTEEFISNLTQLCYAFNLSFRQMNDFLRILSHFFYSEDKKNPGTFGFILASVIYVTLFVANEAFATKIINGNIDFDDFVIIFDNHWNKHDLDQSHKKWWLRMLVYIISNESNFSLNAEKYIKKVQKIDNSNTQYESELNQIMNFRQNIRIDHLGRVSIMQMVAKKINQCLSFYE